LGADADMRFEKPSEFACNEPLIGLLLPESTLRSKAHQLMRDIWRVRSQRVTA